MRQIYKTLALAHIHVERERKRQSLASAVRLAIRLSLFALASFGLPFLLQRLGYLSVIVMAAGAVAVAISALVVGRDSIKVDGLGMSGRVISRLSKVDSLLGGLSLNDLSIRARELAVEIGRKTESSTEGLTGNKSASAITTRFLELYDELANAVNSVEIYTLGTEFAVAANNMRLYLGTSLNQVIVDAIEVMVRDGDLVERPVADRESWLAKQTASLAGAFRKLGVADRLDEKDYQQIWSQDFASLMSKGGGKSIVMGQLNDRRKGLALWQS